MAIQDFEDKGKIQKSSQNHATPSSEIDFVWTFNMYSATTLK